MGRKTEIVEIGGFTYEVTGNKWRPVNDTETPKNVWKMKIIDMLSEGVKVVDTNTGTMKNGQEIMFYLGNVLKKYNFNLNLMIKVLDNWYVEHMNEMNKVQNDE